MKWITMYRYGHDLNDCYSNEMLDHNGMKINVWKCNTSRIASVVDKRSTHIYHMLFFHNISFKCTYYPTRNRLKKEIKDSSKSTVEVCTVITYWHTCSVVILCVDQCTKASANEGQ